MGAILIASRFLTGSILTLVLPLAILIAVAVWYVIIWHHGRDEG